MHIMCTHYITEKCNMLIFARTGVMKHSKDKHIFFHITLILGQILLFSSKNHKKGRDTRPATNVQMTKEKNSLP